MALLKPATELFRFNAPGAKTGPRGTEPAPPDDFTNIAILADAVAAMSRFLSKLSTSAPFATAQLGTAEWLALNIFQRTESSSNKQLAKSLGITGQRAKQICDSLEGSGLILIVPSPVDARRKIITITQAGTEQVIALNNALLQMMRSTPFKDMERNLVKVTNVVRRRFMPVLEPADEQK